jgi:hypothetical protein|tara:strand:+ start:24 stop:875 length:852 start_codon:yes stop_codon:yes gene_type:complete
MGFIGKQPSKAAITSSDITDGVVTAAKLASDSVTTAKIADNGVTTAKINADAVTDAKIADDVVGTEHLTAGEVDTTALGADAVTAAKIADDAISEEHLDATVITGMTELAAEPADTDEFLISDAGTLKRIDYSHIKGGGITTGDMWRTSAHQTISSGSTTVVSSWTQVAYLGSAMTVSSGIWTFPTTGFWLVHYNMYAYKTSNIDYITTYLQATTDNSNYNTIAFGDIQFDANYQTTNHQMIFDVTNTSTHKVRFAHYAPGEFSLRGGSEAQTYAQFIRLGDT